MKILLFALTGFGNKVLDALLEEGCEIKAVFTRKDKFAFPFYAEENFSKYAAKFGIKIYEDFTWEAAEKIIKEYKPDLLLVSTFHRVIPEKIIKLAPLAVNLHPSLLPRYRGATPLDAVLWNNEKKTGVTAHYLVPELDAGDIIIQNKMAVANDDTKNILMRKLAVLSASTAKQLITLIKSGKLISRCQDASQASYFPRFRNKKVLFVLDGRLAKAAELYRKDPDIFIIAMGSKTRLKNPPAVPDASKSAAEKLITMGVPADNILNGKNFSDMAMNLRGIKKIVFRHSILGTFVIFSKRHLAEIKSIINRDNELSEMVKSKKLKLISE